MSINSIQYPAYRPDNAQTARNQAKQPVSSTRKGSILQFSGQAMASAGKNVLWVTLECPPVGGGVASVTKFAPVALARHTDKDLRIMTPYYKPMKREDERLKAEGKDKIAFKKADGADVMLPLAFEATGAEIQLPTYEHGKETPETFRLLQKFNPVLDEKGEVARREDDPNQPKGNWVYAIDNEKYFGRFEKPYSYSSTSPTGQTDDIDADPLRAMNKAIFMFDRAVAGFKPMLEPTEGGGLSKFSGSVDAIIAHDWHAGFLWNELPDSDKSSHIFMVHNGGYDGFADKDMVEQLALRIPDHAKAKNAAGQALQSLGIHGAAPHDTLAKKFMSAQTEGVQGADTIIANHNYVRTMTDTALNKEALFLDMLKGKFRNGLVTDMHHGLPGQDFNPTANQYLQEDKGFKLLKSTAPEDVKEFKKANKLAVQKMLGLNEGEDNVIFTSIGRADPFQKGTYLLMNDAERFLKAPGHEKAQMILVFSDSNPRIGARVKELEQDPALKGRLYISYDKFVPRDVNVPMYAGSDFFMMPSVYEPYGQTQLEGYSMGVVPIGHGVDGIRSSVSDPDLKANPPEKVEEYGQTGILMKPYDAAAYKEAIAFEDRIEGGMEKLKKMQWNQLSFDEMQAMLVYLLHNKQLPEDYAKALQQAQTHFSEAMDRAFNLAQDPDKMNQVRINGMKYFGEEHKDEKIAQKYVDAINLAMQERDKRLASGTQLATFA